jgi:hypothetical protein
MQSSVKIKNFRISGLTIIGIAVALMIFGSILAIPPVDSKTSSSHHSKSSHISSSFNSGVAIAIPIATATHVPYNGANFARLGNTVCHYIYHDTQIVGLSTK